MIYVIGNSHAMFFTNTHPAAPKCDETHEQIRSLSIGPVTAYNFCDKMDLVNQRIDAYNIQKEDTLLMVVGEVDCRVHLPKQISLSSSEHPLEIVNNCVSRYFQALKGLKERGYKVVAVGPHPSTTEPANLFARISSENDEEAAQQPIYGSATERNNITRQFNKRLSLLCSTQGIGFVSIFDKLVSDNRTKMEYYLDYCHLSEAAWPLMEEELQNIGLLDIPEK